MPIELMSNLVELLNIACVNTGKATYYNSKQEQRSQLIKLHTEILLSSRRYYRLLPLLPINDANKILVLQGLLTTGASRNREEDNYEWNIITQIIRGLAITRILRFFVNDLIENRVNNSRVRRLGSYLIEQANEYQLIKYAKKYKSIIIHCRINPEKIADSKKATVINWYFGKVKSKANCETGSLLESRFKAKNGSIKALLRLPMDIAEGIAISNGKSKPEFLALYAKKGKSSKKEQMRIASIDKNVEIDFEQYNYLDLIRFAQQNAGCDDKIITIIQQKAEELAKNVDLPDCFVIIDNSASANGSGERKGYPIAFIEAVARIFKSVATAPDSNIEFCSLNAIDWQHSFKANGATDLRIPLVKAIQSGHKNILILSDGYENQSTGAVDAILNLPIVRDLNLNIRQINPVAAAETTSIKTLSPQIKSLAIAGLEQLPVASFLVQLQNSPELLFSLLEDVDRLMIEGKYREAKKIAQFRNQKFQLIMSH